MSRVFISVVLVFGLLMGCGMNNTADPQEQQDRMRIEEHANPQDFSDSQNPTNSQEPSSTQKPIDEQAPQPNMQADAAQTQIAVFTTPMLDSASGRVHNIALAAQAVDKFVLMPGAVFSFNEVVGNRTAERGYQEAAAIVEGERRQAVGGGVCQLSSTICNAALQCGLEVLERHNHQKPVGYIEPGKDAAVSYGYMDFSFRNNRDYAVQIRASVSTERVVVEIYRLNSENP